MKGPWVMWVKGKKVAYPSAEAAKAAAGKIFEATGIVVGIVDEGAEQERLNVMNYVAGGLGEV